MSIEFTPTHYDHLAIVTCDDCGHVCKAEECGPIKDPGQRLCTGDPCPAGECPECGSLSYAPTRIKARVSRLHIVTAEKVIAFGRLHELDGKVDGKYLYCAINEEDALDQFHSSVPIKVLDDFEITVELSA